MPGACPVHVSTQYSDATLSVSLAALFWLLARSLWSPEHRLQCYKPVDEKELPAHVLRAALSGGWMSLVF